MKNGGYFEKSLNEARRFLRRQKHRDGRFSLQHDSPPTLMATCFGGLCQIVLDGWSDHETKDSVLSSCNPSGRFVDAELKSHEVNSGLHPYEYLADQSHYFAVRYLRACGIVVDRVALPMEMDLSNPIRWIEGMDWTDPWLESNRIMFALELLSKCHTTEYGELISWLVDHWDPDTGFWGTDRGATHVRGMAGAFHFFGFIADAGRALPPADLVVQSTLALQHSDGSFAPNGGGNTCLDMDAIDILCFFWPALSESVRHRTRQALLKALEGNFSLQQSDGGFSESRSSESRRTQLELGTKDMNQVSQTWQGCQRIRYSSWSRMEYDATQSDLWSTMSRVICLRRIQQVLDADAFEKSGFSITGGGIGQFIQANRTVASA